MLARLLTCGVIVVAVCAGAGPAPAGEALPAWPQFHGPDQTNRSPDTGLLKAWPEAGPPLLWKTTGLGHGFAGVSIAGGLVYTTGNVDGKTLITAVGFDGRVAWRTPNGPAWTREVAGTRSTPTIDAGRLYHQNADGDLSCLEAATGKRLWHVNTLEAFGGRNIKWGLSESVVIDGDRVIATPGGREVGLVALHKHSGKPVWTCTGTRVQPGYATPAVFTHDGLRQIVTCMASTVVGVHADTGRLLWQAPYPAKFDENIVMPLFHDGHVFVTSRTTGGRLLRLKVDGQACTVEAVWSAPDFDVQHEGIVLIDGYLYGTSMRRRSAWMCLDVATGRTAWTADGIGRASVTWADGHIYAVSHGGRVALVKPSPKAYEEVGTFQLPSGGKGPVWAHPVVIGGRLYLRHADTLFCYDVSAK